MNRILALGLVLSASPILSLAAGSQQVVFERGAAIWIANLDGSNAHKVTKGVYPDISPDGSQIVFNTNDSDGAELVRQIAMSMLQPGKSLWSKQFRARIVTSLTGHPMANRSSSIFGGTKIGISV